jgi:hypothetical protein
MSDTSIELPKPKRVYKKKVTAVEPATEPSPQPTPEPIQDLPPVDEPTGSYLSQPETSPKVKRVYKRKTPVVDTVPPVVQQELARKGLDIPVEIPVEVPLEMPTVPGPITKKPRTEKQIQAFNKMREARIKKQQELEDLKAFQKEQALLEKEQAKLEKVEEQIIKKKATRKPSPRGPGLPGPRGKSPLPVEQIPQVNNVSTHKVLLFV